jgi:hypothetical protein
MEHCILRLCLESVTIMNWLLSFTANPRDEVGNRTTRLQRGTNVSLVCADCCPAALASMPLAAISGQRNSSQPGVGMSLTYAN